MNELTDEHSAADIEQERREHKQTIALKEAGAGIQAIVDMLRELADKLEGSLV